MQKFRKVYVDSAHRTSGTSTNFTWEAAQDIQCTGECHVAVASVVIPNSLFSVQTNVNDKLYIYENHPTVDTSSVNRIVTLAAGNYSATALNVALQVVLRQNALGSAVYTCSYNDVQQRITITQTSGGGFVVYDDHTLKTVGRKNPATGGLYGTLPTIPNPQSLQQALGIPTAPTTPGVTFQSGVITLARVTSAYLRSPDLSNMNTMDSNGRLDVLKRIPISSEFGTLIVGSDNIETSDLMQVSNRTLRALTFVLTDGHGNQLDLHNHDISFTLNFIFGVID